MILFIGFLVVGIPVTLLILKLLDKYCEKVSLSRGRRVLIAILGNFLCFLLLSACIITEPSREDRALDIALEDTGLVLPSKRKIDIVYPNEWNHGDDFEVKKTWRLRHAPSDENVEILKQLCRTDDRWSFSDGAYHFSEDIFDFELRIHLNIDSANRMIITQYQEF